MSEPESRPERRWFAVENLRIVSHAGERERLSLVDAIDACKELCDSVEELAAKLDVRLSSTPRSCVDD